MITNSLNKLKPMIVFLFQAHQSGDQPPSLSTDEESGSSTSSCEEDIGLQNNATPSGSSSPARRNHVDGNRQPNGKKKDFHIKIIKSRSV
jgi:hypothetical protein